MQLLPLLTLPSCWVWCHTCLRTLFSQPLSDLRQCLLPSWFCFILFLTSSDAFLRQQKLSGIYTHSRHLISTSDGKSFVTSLSICIIILPLVFALSVRKGTELVGRCIKAWTCTARLCSLCYLFILTSSQCQVRHQNESVYHVIWILNFILVPLSVLLNQEYDTLHSWISLAFSPE